MAGERAQLRNELLESSSLNAKHPRQRARNSSQALGVQKRLPKRQSTHRPISVIAGRPRFVFVSSFQDAKVAGLTWGQFFDLSLEGKHQLVCLMVQERSRNGNLPQSKGKNKATARVGESALSEAALAVKDRMIDEVTNFYTEAWINHILIDASSVINLAATSVLQDLVAPLSPTKDLVICTAVSNLVPLEYYTDLQIEVASIRTVIQVYAMPALCEPTYGLLLSRRWVRRYQAISDYARETYVIKDDDGGNYFIAQEMQVMKIGKIHRPKVTINPDADGVDLGKDLVEDLELDKLFLFSEIVKHIAWEAREELAVYQALELQIGHESDSRDNANNEENEEHINLASDE
ncbi:hypothetical protein L873DRAFT_1795324 [Choiromyces venosus 120613-1]|uniref:Uncharacterized protein n=1 Tax=Choiromyces venosus 120613-1 TaxID=1336337 RepID=A0A3N4IXV5_9PEZI|nr:hypothetical protein L873DRAFT_1795324 [Choiromyces venosus 120613-1]